MRRAKASVVNTDSNAQAEYFLFCERDVEERIMSKKIAFIVVLFMAVMAAQNVFGSNLPESVTFRDNSQSFNTVYFSAVQDGDIYVKQKSPEEGDEMGWQKLALPDGLAGDVVELSSDDEYIMATNSRRELYTMFKGLGDIETFNWVKRWGSPFWYGKGLSLPDDIITWDISYVSNAEDEYYVDEAGNKQGLGPGVTTLFALRGDGSKITYWDPWLAVDESREIATPVRGRFKAATMSASGSLIFIMNEYGDMYTRIYDFDVCGADWAQFDYSYYDQTGNQTDEQKQPWRTTLATLLSMREIYAPLAFDSAPRQLPAPDWIHHAKIEGEITNRISVHKTGKGVENRVIKVEGWDADGNTGYYEKEALDLSGSSDWKFVRTDQEIQGKELINTLWDNTEATLVDGEDMNYSGEGSQNLVGRLLDIDWTGKIEGFNIFASPAAVTITINGEIDLELTLHSTEDLRLLPRDRGITNTPLLLRGAVEIPVKIINHLEYQPESVRKFLKRNNFNEQFNKVKISVTTDHLKLISPVNVLKFSPEVN